MQISYKTDNVVLASDVTSYTEEKLAAVERLLVDEGNASCEVLLSRDEKHQSGLIYRVDFTLFTGKERIHAVGHGESLMAALDIAKDELANRVRREKKLHVRVMRKSGAVLKRIMRFGSAE
ncbi:ribosome-associated translation inhibitor RaiA [bacterium]|nr:ribosome-associated translation inhibitor RaiA [bacterium]